jgi:hypothetical protein
MDIAQPTSPHAAEVTAVGDDPGAQVRSLTTLDEAN